jgi:general secretion pathway protein E
LRHIVEALALQGLIKESEVDHYCFEIQRRGESIHKILRQKPDIEPEQLTHFWLSVTSWERCPASDQVEVNLPYIDQFGVEYSRQNGCLVLNHGTDFYFACIHPLSLSSCDEISIRLQYQLKKCIISEKDFNRFLEQNFSFTAEDRDLPQLDEQSIEKLQREIAKSDDLLDMANKAPVVRLINGILFQALQQRSSDIRWIGPPITGRPSDRSLRAVFSHRALRHYSLAY